MSLKEQVYSVLIVSSANNFNSAIKELLPESKYSPVNIVLDIYTAKRELSHRPYDFILINSPLPDDFGTSFAIDTGSSRETVVLQLIRSDVHDEIYDEVTQHGVLTLAKPTSKAMLIQAFRWMASTRERLRKSAKKSLSIEEKMAEIRVVNRAKWILITELKMSEPDAHRYIEKQSMDQCISKRQIAEEIIKTYS